tara:strand:+ start:149 stop:502 length:354 start_codon:yes stop_codon:yes gene_type:complete
MSNVSKVQPKWTDVSCVSIVPAANDATTLSNDSVETWEIIEVVGVKDGAAAGGDTLAIATSSGTYVTIDLNIADDVVFRSAAVNQQHAEWAPGTSITFTSNDPSAAVKVCNVMVRKK